MRDACAVGGGGGGGGARLGLGRWWWDWCEAHSSDNKKDDIYIVFAVRCLGEKPGTREE